MRVVLFALTGLILGAGAGGGFEGLRQKSRILELRADSLEQALADSALATTHALGEGADSTSAEAEPHAPVEPDEPDAEGQHVTPDDSLAVPSPADEGAEGAEADGDTGDGATEDLPSPQDAASRAQEPGSRDETADPPAVSTPDVASTDLTPVEMARTAREAIGVPEALERLGKIFMAMKPRDAAAVLEHLNDREVEAILFQLREKNAAQILGNFPPDRAAVLSRSVLQRSGSI